MLVYHRPNHTGDRFEYYTSVNIMPKQNKKLKSYVVAYGTRHI